jgi:uncharacterized protein (TIGR00299 family) protein
VTTLYIDCFAGVAGDMMLAALVEIGVPEKAIHDALAKLGLPAESYSLRFEKAKRGALVGGRAVVEECHHHHHHDDHDHRHWSEIRPMLERLDGETRRIALDVFTRIAEVEAKMHGVAVDEVAFHEVGAIDSIVDIVGCAAGLAWLNPTRVVSRPVALGGGTVKTAHGVLPVPAPATMALLVGAEVEAGGKFELTTPTGAAIVAAMATEFGPLPRGKIVATGFGAGTRELDDRPNMLRLALIESSRPSPAPDGARGGDEGQPGEQMWVVEANLDDMNPELAEPLRAALSAAGAVDVWFTPTLMKKGRPAITAAALGADREKITQAFLRESTTIGVRAHRVERTILPRRFVEVETPWGKVPVKVAGPGDEVWNAAPEHDACAALAAAAGVPVKLVYASALAAFFRK